MDHDRPTLSGKRKELADSLRNVSSGCMGSDELRDAARDGAERLEGHQASSVQVGKIDYVVTDEDV